MTASISPVSFIIFQQAPLEPKPKQKKMPLMIGGGGEKVTLKIAAKYADEWNVWGNVDTLIRKMTILDQHCETVGRDPSSMSVAQSRCFFSV